MLVGSAPAWRESLSQLVEAALFTQHPVLVTGENGTGKELAAQLIHRLDAKRKSRELVVLDCSTVVPELSGSEFFGHERGAFTSALGSREGALARAHEGTLFLDEVGELPLRLQGELLRAIQEKSFKRVGGNTWTTVDFRLVSATNRDLELERRRGGFREDFFHRIASWRVRLPSLAERREDIPALAERFLSQERPEATPVLSRDVEEFLVERDWPGNVRELRQFVRRLAARWNGHGPLGAGCVPPEERPVRVAAGDPHREPDPPSHTHLAPPKGTDPSCDTLEQAVAFHLRAGSGLGEIKDQASEIAYRLALDSEDGNVQRAARLLQVSDRSVQLYLKSSRQAETEAPSPLPDSVTTGSSRSSGG